MTDLATAPPAFDLDPIALGEAAAAAILAVPGLQPAPMEDEGVALPNEEPTILKVDLGDGARAVLVISKTVSRRLQVGPPPAEDLFEAIAEPLAAIAATVGLTPQGPPTRGDKRDARANKGESAIAVRLIDSNDGTHAVTAILVGTVPEPDEAEDDSAPVHEFAPLPEPTKQLAHTGLELLHEVSLGVTAELGRTEMLVRDVLSLAPGSVIELDRAAGSPVDVLVNGTLIARGEVVVIDEEFGIRITEVVGYIEGTNR